MKKLLILITMLCVAVFALAQITPPYTENFDGVTPPALPANWTVADGNADAIQWETYGSYANSLPNCLFIYYNSALAMDDWAFTPALNLTAGTVYSLQFKYRSGGFTEKLAVHVGTSASVAGMGVTPLTDLTFSNTSYATETVILTVPTSGTYYLGFHGHSDADMYYIALDDISLDVLTVYPFPYAQDFEAPATAADADWGGNMYIAPGHGLSGTKGLTFNLYDEDGWRSCNAISCAIGPLPAASELKFSYRIVNWDGYPATATVLNTGDLFQVEVSTDYGVTYTPIVTIDYTNHVTSNQYAAVTYPLNTYVGDTVLIRFVGTYGVEVGHDYFFDIDNVILRVPSTTTPILSYAPLSISFGSAFVGDTLGPQNVIVTNISAGTIDLLASDVSIIGADATQFSFSAVNLPETLTEDMSVVIPVYFTPTTAGVKSATLRIVNNQSRTNYDIALSGSGFPLDALSEGFEGPDFPPAYWQQSGTLWGTSNNAAYVIAGTKSAIIFQDYTDPEEMLITPRVLLDGSVTILSFTTRGVNSTFGSGSSFLQMKFKLDGTTTWQNLGTPIDYALLPNNSTVPISYDISSIANGVYNFAFSVVSTFDYLDYSSWVLIDQVLGPQMFIPSDPPDPVALNFPADFLENLPKNGFNFTWIPAITGGIPTHFGIYISTDPLDIWGQEYWETTNTYFNPVAEQGFSFAFDQVYYWQVQAINVDGDSFSAVRRFTIEPEVLFNNITLTGSVNQQSIQLSWYPTYDDGTGSWITWSGAYTNNIGTGSANTFMAASKFLTTEIATYNGQYLHTVGFVPGSAGTYKIKIWTGDDLTLAPQTLIYEQYVGDLIYGQWNEVPLLYPVQINSSLALYFGYEVTVTGGSPLASDAGPEVLNQGGLIFFGGAWYNISALNPALTYNWCLRAYITPTSGSRDAQLLNIPVVDNRSLNTRIDRGLFKSEQVANSGENIRYQPRYNVYRDNVLITPTPVIGRSYLDSGLAIGSYTYYVEALYTATEVASNEWTGQVVYVPPLELPFFEDWSSGLFTTNNWDPETGYANWILDNVGNPAPGAVFYWDPQQTGYSISLTSFDFNGVGLSSVKLAFDLYLDNYDTLTENFLTVEVWDGAIWQGVATYSSFAGGADNLILFGELNTSYDISAYASNRQFKVRFRAHGADTYSINFWIIDNIEVAEMPAVIDYPFVYVEYNDPNILVTWDDVPEADWYGIYSADDPYGAYTYLGWVHAMYIGVNLPATAEKKFYQVSAGAGPTPGGRELIGRN